MGEVVTIGNATLYHGDCIEILTELSICQVCNGDGVIVPMGAPDQVCGDCNGTGRTKLDAIVTDPPYGIDFAYESHDDSLAGWERLMRAFVPIAQSIAKVTVMPACAQTRMAWWYANFPPLWVIAWFKGSPGHLSKIGFSCWESHLVWGKPPKQIHDHFQTALVIDKNGHPCPKPVAYSEWLVSRMSQVGDVVVDPFMGSGTTGVACANLGRKFIGIEIDRKYFDIACDRIGAVSAQHRLFDDRRPKQEVLIA